MLFRSDVTAPADAATHAANRARLEAARRAAATRGDAALAELLADALTATDTRERA